MSVSGEPGKAKLKSSFMSKGKVRKMIPYRYWCRSSIQGCFVGISGSGCLAGGLSLGGVSIPDTERCCVAGGARERSGAGSSSELVSGCSPGPLHHRLR